MNYLTHPTKTINITQSYAGSTNNITSSRKCIFPGGCQIECLKQDEVRFIYYRYTYKELGIYEALKQAMSFNEWMAAKTDGTFNWLPIPDVYKLNGEYESYFTITGNKLFEDKVLPIVKKHLDYHMVKKQIYDNLNDVVYEDEYQVVKTKS